MFIGGSDVLLASPSFQQQNVSSVGAGGGSLTVGLGCQSENRGNGGEIVGGPKWTHF